MRRGLSPFPRPKNIYMESPYTFFVTHSMEMYFPCRRTVLATLILHAPSRRKPSAQIKKCCNEIYAIATFSSFWRIHRFPIQ